MKFNQKTIAKSFKHGVLRPLYLLLAVFVLSSHNLYIKLESYFLEPNQEATLSLYNGTFETSENVITRDRILDASIVAQNKRMAIDSAKWKDKDSTLTQLSFNTGEAGTYVVGVSTKARNIQLTAEKFNSYLEHDGVIDMLARRTENNQLGQDAIESYQKHVKAIYQVGDVKTNDWQTVLGYPIEFVPQANPYDTYTGETLDIQLLLDGKPLKEQLVYADFIPVKHNHDHDDHHNHEGHDHGDHDHDAHSHDHDDKAHSHDHKGDEHHHDHDGHDHGDHDHDTHGHNHYDKAHAHEHEGNGHHHDHDSHDHSDHDHDAHSHGHDDKAHSHDHADHKHRHDDEAHHHNHDNAQQLLTNEQGIVSVDLPEDGIYYIRTIHMVNVVDNEALTHRSKWATLTFEITHKHGDGSHTHSHDDEGEIPSWIFIVSSILIVGLLFIVFRKK